MRLSLRFSLDQCERRIAAYEPQSAWKPGFQRSAVAALLRFGDEGAEVLLMKRAERDGDRWSGHVSFPGGRESPGDPDLLSTAVRETREEVGLDLNDNARLLGQLDTIQAVARGGLKPLSITPFVFVQTREAALVLNHEAVDVFWLPLERVALGELSSIYEVRLGSSVREMPCWIYQGHTVWGLTYHMIAHLIQVVAGE